MTCNAFSGMICYVIIFLYYVRLKFSSVIYLGQVSHLLSLHLKIQKPGVDWLSLAAAYIG